MFQESIQSRLKHSGGFEHRRSVATLFLFSFNREENRFMIFNFLPMRWVTRTLSILPSIHSCCGTLCPQQTRSLPTPEINCAQFKRCSSIGGYQLLDSFHLPQETAGDALTVHSLNPSAELENRQQAHPNPPPPTLPRPNRTAEPLSLCDP